MVQSAVLIVLMIGASKEDASTRLGEIYQKVVIPAKNELNILVTPLPVHEKYYNEFFEDINGAKFSYKLVEGAKPPKGFNVTHILKSGHLLDCKPDYIIYCDGSGRIPFENCIRLLNELKKRENLCILSERTPWRASIPPIRQCIEQFESYVVSKIFGSDEVYDLQCGLWGFLYPECSNFTISCVGYELELNVACEAFKKAGKVGLMIVQLNMSNASLSQFQGEDFSTQSAHYQKAYFLYKYFNLKKADLLEHATHYNSKVSQDRKLPEEYMYMLDEIDGEIKKPTITKLG